MERIISFVTDNFFVVIIVVGLIYSMFFRKSPLEKRPPNRMPEFGSGPLFPQRPARPAAQASPPPLERKPPQPEYRLPPAEPASRPQWLDSQPQPEYRLPPDEPVSRRLERSDLAQATAVPGAAAAAAEPVKSSLTADDLTRAVVWAEILGPPRSRRPFRR